MLDRRQVLKRVGLGAAALAVPAAVMASPAIGAVTDALAADSFIKSHPKWKFVFVNHVTTNPFFVPTIYGAQDACSLLGSATSGPGRTRPTSAEMVNAFNSAISREGDGISFCLVDPTAFNAPTDKALDKGIPVLAYNAECPRTTAAGVHRPGSLPVRATAWVSASSTSSRAATSRSSSPPRGSSTSSRASTALQAAIKKFGKGKIKTSVIATGALLPDELAKIDAYYLGHKDVKGMFAVDAGYDTGHRPGHAEVRPRRRRASRPAATT